MSPSFFTVPHIAFTSAPEFSDERNAANRNPGVVKEALTFSIRERILSFNFFFCRHSGILKKYIPLFLNRGPNPLY